MSILAGNGTDDPGRRTPDLPIGNRDGSDQERTLGECTR